MVNCNTSQLRKEIQSVPPSPITNLRASYYMVLILRATPSLASGSREGACLTPQIAPSFSMNSVYTSGIRRHSHHGIGISNKNAQVAWQVPNMELHAKTAAGAPSAGTAPHTAPANP